MGVIYIKCYSRRLLPRWGFKVMERVIRGAETQCPWNGPVPEMVVYAYRGARMLSKSLWKGKCFTCYYIV